MARAVSGDRLTPEQVMKVARELQLILEEHTVLLQRQKSTIAAASDQTKASGDPTKDAATPAKSPAKSGPIAAAALGTPRLELSTDGDDNYPRKRPDKVMVEVSIVFMKINSIDTIHDCYSAEVRVHSRWKEPRLDNFRTSDVENIDWTQYWNPKLYIDNAIGEPRDTVDMTLTIDQKTGQATVCETRRVTGTLFEFMELNKFPFDSQDLTVTVATERTVAELELIECRSEPSGINTGAFSAEQEWKLRSWFRAWAELKTRRINNAAVTSPVFRLATKASRRPQFFVWNIITVMCVICSLAFASFTCTPNQPQFRLQLTFILLLTTVTFKFAVNKNIPQIPYLTIMDKYILGSMIILFVVCIWHAVVGGVIHRYSVIGSLQTSNKTVTGTPPTAETIMADQIALGLFGGAYVLFHAAFFVFITDNARKLQADFDLDDGGQTSIGCAGSAPPPPPSRRENYRRLSSSKSLKGRSVAPAPQSPSGRDVTT